MARGRMLRPSISTDPEVNSMSDFAQLLFTWMIAHADDYGVLPGNPLELWALVVPFKTDRRNDVAAAIDEMVVAGLIYHYEVERKWYIQLAKWENNQQGLNKRTAPRNPLYKSSVAGVPGISENF